MGYSPWSHKESDLTERLSTCAHTHTHTHIHSHTHTHTHTHRIRKDFNFYNLVSITDVNNFPVLFAISLGNCLVI